MTISDILNKYMKTEGLTLRQMASALNVKSHATIINWRDGKSEPETDLLMQLKDFGDWRGEFAREVLKIKYPTFGG